MRVTRMSEDAELLAIHHTVLVTWAVQQLGKALLFGALAAFVAVIVLFSVNHGDPDASTGWAALGVGLFVFALYLASGRAPLPRVKLGTDED